MNDVQQMLQMYNAFRNNPSQLLNNVGIPQNIMNNPQAILQHLMNSGKVSQEQYNQAVRMANSFRGNK